MAVGKTTKWSWPRNLMHEDTAYRLRVWALWALIVVAAVSGVAGLLRPQPRPVVSDTSSVTEPQVDARWLAAGFAERFVTTYLSSPADSETLAAFLGYTPQLPASPVADGTAPGSVRTVEVASAGEDYWAVTVAVDRRDAPLLDGDRDNSDQIDGEPADAVLEGEPADGDQADGAPDSPATGGDMAGERFWQVAVDVSGVAPVAAGLPALVAAPRAAEPVDVAVELSGGPVDDPATDAFTGFLEALLCGGNEGDLDRWLAPGVEVTAVEPAVCEAIEIARSGSDELEGGGRRVVAEVDLQPGARRMSYAAVLAQRAGRWEVAELLPAPPRHVEPEPSAGSSREIDADAGPGSDSEEGTG